MSNIYFQYNWGLVSGLKIIHIHCGGNFIIVQDGKKVDKKGLFSETLEFKFRTRCVFRL